MDEMMNSTCREILYKLSIQRKINYFHHEFPKPFKLEKTLKDVLEVDVDEKYYLSEAIFTGVNEPKIERWVNKKTGSVLDDICPTLRAGGGTDIRKLPRVHIQKGVKGGEHDISPTLTINSWQENNHILEQVIYDDYNGAFKTDGTTCAITTNAGSSSARNGQKVITDRIRKLTPKECWRLQGFSDESFQKAKDAGISDSQLYKQAGNSITVDVMEYLIKSIIEPKKNDSLF